MTCKDCIHLKACAKWYPEKNLIRDNCHNDCECFDDGSETDEKEGD